MPLDATKVAECQTALALALLVDPVAVPDVNRAILLLDEARKGLNGLDPIIALLFNKPVPRVEEAIIRLRALLPDAANKNAIDQAMSKMQQATRAIDALIMPIMMWRQLLDSAPTPDIRATAARKLQLALEGQRQNADALRRAAADVSGCVSVVYKDSRASSSQNQF